MSHGCQEIASANPQQRDRDPGDKGRPQAKRVRRSREGRWDDVLSVVRCRVPQHDGQQGPVGAGGGRGSMRRGGARAPGPPWARAGSEGATGEEKWAPGVINSRGGGVPRETPAATTVKKQVHITA